MTVSPLPPSGAASGPATFGADPGGVPIPGGLTTGALGGGEGEARAARSRALSGNLIAALSMAIWALGFPAAEVLLATWDPLAIVPARFAMALLLLLPLWLVVEGLPRGVPWGRGLLVGGLGIGAGAITLILAQAATDPVTVAVIASVSPLAGTLVEWAGERRPLTRAFGLGLVASVVGGVVATFGGETAGGLSLLLGGGLAVLSCLLYSWGSHECVRALPGRSALAQTAVSVTGAFLATLAVAAGAWALGRPGLPASGVGLSDLGLLAVYGMGGMAVSQLLFVVGVKRIGIALASFHTNAAPFYVMLMMLALGGTWSWAQAAGAAIVALGVLLAQRR